MFNRTRALIRKGDAARDRRHWPTARAAYRAALDRNPALAPIWVQYGHALKEAGSPQEALGAYLRADTLSPGQADTQLQIARALDLVNLPEAAREHHRRAASLANPDVIAPRARPPGMPERLRFVALGTTGTCNASCVHCPTGKAETAHVPRGTMAMDLFQKIIDGIGAYGLPVSDQIAFGLFGDGLVDPLVVERAAYLRTRLPVVPLTVNTNGAAFNAAKHAPLNDLVTTVALHCESLETETYNDLMRPLRLDRVKPKFEQILQTFPGKVIVSVPISTRNRDEAGAIQTWFRDRGARDVVFDPLSSRCATDRTLFDSLALNPVPIRCPPVIMDDLIVDSDGQVLICCQDFQRVEGIGSMATESFADILTGLHRQTTRKRLAENRHAEIATCNRCFADVRWEFVPA